MTNTEQIAAGIIVLERTALDRWGAGAPSGYLDISAPEVTYFDPFIERRIDGLEALSAWYAPLRGTIHVDRYEMLAPKVQVYGEVAVLTFNLVSHSGATVMRWNCTEVYQHDKDGWRIVQTHWSITQPMQG
ncbi:hypothetical protein FGKAn22_16340 [Ferrigenium kumadai]|uniref:SnoaL-like domain-containing protein n=1 Tax=Ferrigenium kumadai TaxID=1682490 RepID=A0AAN1T0I6_9PROT|nr:nuclear transport factor 2 family protein [Ferrigenium kumadai]BBI99941.1 hypothetical protein FGKAn22_16340 [Ferrigenium kumadai]